MQQTKPLNFRQCPPFPIFFRLHPSSGANAKKVETLASSAFFLPFLLPPCPPLPCAPLACQSVVGCDCERLTVHSFSNTLARGCACYSFNQTHSPCGKTRIGQTTNTKPSLPHFSLLLPVYAIVPPPRSLSDPTGSVPCASCTPCSLDKPLHSQSNHPFIPPLRACLPVYKAKKEHPGCLGALGLSQCTQISCQPLPKSQTCEMSSGIRSLHGGSRRMRRRRPRECHAGRD